MKGPHGHCPYGRRYDSAANVLHRGAPEASAKFAAINLADPGIPPYYFIKNCILAASTQGDEEKAEIYRLNAEHRYTSSLCEATGRPDDGSLKALQDLRVELDQLHASRPTPGPACEPASLPPLPSLASLWPAPPSPLPADWEAHVDPSSGQYYYFHPATQTTQWNVPTGPLPRGWTAHLDPKSSQCYYHHALTRSTQWELPKAPYEMDNEDEDENKDGDYEDEDGDYEDEDGDYEEEREDEGDAEAPTQSVEPASKHENPI